MLPACFCAVAKPPISLTGRTAVSLVVFQTTFSFSPKPLCALSSQISTCPFSLKTYPQYFMHEAFLHLLLPYTSKRVWHSRLLSPVATEMLGVEWTSSITRPLPHRKPRFQALVLEGSVSFSSLSQPQDQGAPKEIENILGEIQFLLILQAPKTYQTVTWAPS